MTTQIKSLNKHILMIVFANGDVCSFTEDHFLVIFFLFKQRNMVVERLKRRRICRWLFLYSHVKEILLLLESFSYYLKSYNNNELM